MTRYLLAHAARKDLVEILEYIAEDSLDRALEVLDRLEEVFELLTDNPDIGHHLDRED